MFKTTMPVFEQKEVDGKLITTEKQASITIDTSIFSEQRWESNFPKQAEKETLNNYITRLMKRKSNSTTYVLSCLKALYCFMKSDEFPDFESFCQQFTMSDMNQLKKTVDRTQYIFNLALNSSSASPKN